MKTAQPITIFWLGFLMAISFFEAPLKFQAPTIDLPTGLQIGKLVFFWLNKVELLAFTLLCASLLFIKEKINVKRILMVLGVLLLSQTLWLLPLLEERAILHISGNIPESTYHHILYVIMEIVKVVLLIWLAIAQMKGYRERLVKSD